MRKIARVASALGFDDLALLAWEEAHRIAVAGNEDVADASDAIDCANIHFRLGNVAEAEARFRRAIEECVARADFANAASASTNLAAIMSDAGYFGAARDLLDASLDYVAREPFPDTELNTRLMLIQVLEALEAEPTDILDIASALEQFDDILQGQARTVVRDVVERALTRQAHTAAAQSGREGDFAWLFR